MIDSIIRIELHFFLFKWPINYAFFHSISNSVKDKTIKNWKISINNNKKLCDLSPLISSENATVYESRPLSQPEHDRVYPMKTLRLRKCPSSYDCARWVPGCSYQSLFSFLQPYFILCKIYL